MAITGKFLADFTSFQDAVQKATVSLKGMETGAGTVSKSLNSMVDSFSGRKIVQDAELMSAAFEQLASKGIGLTNRELQRMGAVSSEAIEKLRAGGETVPPGIQKIADAAANAAKKTSDASDAAARSAISFKSLFSAFSLANLATSGVSMLTAAVGDMVDKGTRLPAIEQGFERLAIGIGVNSQDMLQSLQTATKGMVSNLELMQSTNKAVLLGLPVTAESMGELASAATALGRAMGMDATKSLDDLITALGRSSPMILDNLGLSVKLGDANEAMALKLGKSASELTEAEKKMAFYEAAMEAARKKTAELGDQTKTFGEIATTVWTSVSNKGVSAVGDLNVGLGRILSNMESLQAFFRAGPGGGGFAIVSEANKQRADDLANTLDRMVKTGARDWGAFNSNLGITVQSLSELDDETKELEQADKKYRESVEKTAAAQQKAAELGVKAFKDHQKYLKDVADQTAAVNLQMGILVKDRLEALGTRGQAVLKAMTDESVRFAVAMSGNLPIVEGLGNNMAILGAKSDIGLKPIMPLLNTFKLNLDDLSKSLSQLATVAGGSFGTIASSLATMVAAADTAKKSIDTIKEGAKAGFSLDGILGMTTGISGIVSVALTAISALKKLFSLGGPSEEQLAGRQLIADFHEQLESMLTAAQRAEAGNEAWKIDVIAIRDAYLAAGKTVAEAEAATKALWQSAEQGSEGARRAIAAIQAVIGKNTDATEDATAATEEQAQATIETATQAAKALDELGPRIHQNEDEWRGWGGVVTDVFDAVARAVRSIPLPSVPGSSAGGPSAPVEGFASGTGGRFRDFGAGTPAILHGRERIMTEREAVGGEITIVVPVSVAGQVIANVNAKANLRQLMNATRLNARVAV